MKVFDFVGIKWSQIVFSSKAYWLIGMNKHYAEKNECDQIKYIRLILNVLYSYL